MAMQVWQIDEDFMAARSEQEAVAEWKSMTGAEPESVELLDDEALRKMKTRVENEDGSEDEWSLRDLLDAECGDGEKDAYVISSLYW
jgi:hypothetical protein